MLPGISLLVTGMVNYLITQWVITKPQKWIAHDLRHDERILHTDFQAEKCIPG